MNALRRLPVRLRLTLAFAAAMAVLFAGIAVGLYRSVAAALQDEVDTGLRSRAATIEASVRGQDLGQISPSSGLIESNEAIAQIVRPDGTVLQSSFLDGRGAVLSPSILASLSHPALFERGLPGVAGVTRLLAVPVRSGASRVVVIVGSSQQDRADALTLLTVFLAIGGPLALGLSSFAGWLLAGSALRPVEQMRQQASAISVSGMDRRLTVPEPDDEIGRLARTLNAMLDRLRDSFEGERRFLDNASHELRTPLAVLRTELDLALSRPRSPEELTAALRSASDETDRLARLADDLLVLSRAHGGRLPVHRTEIVLGALTAASSERFRARADAAGVRIESDAPGISVFVDDVRVRQAVDNLLDNAIRYAPPGSAVTLCGSVEGSTVRIVVEDRGPGFPNGFEQKALEPFVRAEGASRQHEGAGLGLAIVRAIAESHAGRITAENRADGGARVTLEMNGGGVGGDGAAI